MSITRRDFLNGAALTIAAGLTPAAQIAAQPARYPPALTGLRGQHEGSFEIAHALAREGRKFPIDGLPVEETYDLVVVGGGISGLAAAWFYRRAKPSARILILDNHDDFGGHAKRNEFTLDGRRIIGYGGSQSLQSPNSLYSPVAKGLLRDLGVDITRFETAFERDLYPSLGLSRGMFFNREAFGRDVLVTGDPGRDEEKRARRNAKPLAEFVSGFPISEASKAQIVALYAGASDPLAGKSRERKARHPETHQLSRLSDEDLRLQRGGGELLPGPPARLLRARQRRGAGRRRARSRLSGLRRPEAPGRHQRGVAGALHLSFPRRQCVDRAAPGPLAHSRRGAGQHDGRRRAGGVRLWRARPRRSAGPHPPRFDLRPCRAKRATRRRSPMCAMARSIASRRATRCSPAST